MRKLSVQRRILPKILHGLAHRLGIGVRLVRLIHNLRNIGIAHRLLARLGRIAEGIALSFRCIGHASTSCNGSAGCHDEGESGGTQRLNLAFENDL